MHDFSEAYRLIGKFKACGLMNPYYTVFFSPAIQQPLQEIGRIFARAGYLALIKNAA